MASLSDADFKNELSKLLLCEWAFVHRIIQHILLTAKKYNFFQL